MTRTKRSASEGIAYGSFTVDDDDDGCAGVERPEEALAEAILEHLRRGRQPHAAEPDVEEPVIRGQEQRDERQPSPARAPPIPSTAR